MKTPIKRIPTTLKLAREGDVFFVLIPNYWGKGATLDEAIARVKSQRSIGEHWRVFSAHPTTYCDEIMGSLIYPRGHDPIVLAETEGT